MTKIETVNISEDMNEDSNKFLKMSEIYWKDYLRDKNYNKDINQMCNLCIEEQTRKYGKITIPCKGLADARTIAGAELYDEITEGFTDEEKTFLDCSYDPYLFMDTMLDRKNIGKEGRIFERRWYQENLLRCLDENTLVTMEDGSTKFIKDIVSNDIVLTIDEYSKEIVPKRVIDGWCSGHKFVYQLHTDDNHYLLLTEEHPVLVQEKGKLVYKTIEEGLSKGFTIVTYKNGKISYHKITSITEKGLSRTFDIEVEDNHNFIANEIFVHNCTARSKVVRMGRRTGKTRSLAMLVIHKMIMNPKFRVLLVSPYAVQTEEVVNTIKELCAELPENPIESSKATPAHKIVFTNGAILMGFTASTDGNQIRGQPADLIVLDEVDDIPEKAIISIMGIKMQNPEVEIWKSGTPKGELNLSKGENDENTKAFHYPSYVNPNYNDKMDSELRAEMGEGVGYIQEVLAETGVMSNGVFQSVFINRALQRSEFIDGLHVLDKAHRHNYIVVIGVDWNHDKVGTRIIIVAYDKNIPQFHIIERERVAIEGFTQSAAMDKIKELNRLYNADHIFVDQGFGATQIGELKLFGESQAGLVPKGHPDLKLMNIEAVDYGSSTDIPDPMTGEVYKQPTKQVAVQNTVLVLEKDLLTLNPSLDNEIVKQLKNYIEVSRNKGKITYGYVSPKIGDHDLDALMIALYGYRKLYSSLFIGAAAPGMLKFGQKKDITDSSYPAKPKYESEEDSGASLKFAKPVLFGSRNSSINGGIRQKRRMF